MNRTYLAVGLLSSSVIALQLFLMQLLSLSQWHHFAALVISVALLGFGASGTYIALFRGYLVPRSDRLIPWSMLVSGVAMAVSLSVTQLEILRFDSLRVFVEGAQLVSVAATCLVLFIPFFFAALAIGLVFVRDTERAGSIYFANMVGSGCGGLIAILLMSEFVPERLPAIAGMIALLAALFSLPRRGAGVFVITLSGALLVVVSALILSSPPILSEYKDLSRTMHLPNATITYSKPSSQGFLQIVSSPALRHAPGVSLKFAGEIPVRRGVFNNGNWYGPLNLSDETSAGSMVDFSTMALPYVIRPRDRVLVLGARTGSLVAHAVERGAGFVVGIEDHGTLVSLLQGEFAEGIDSLSHRPGVYLHAGGSRAYLLAGGPEFDLIILPLQGSFGGSAGLYALREEYVLTVEAMRGMWNRL
ncbi:MAG: hypothetical protein KAJ12_05460 [Bacteroidetes bacterium]|nr:hypothetical protein [Bacteroidota bacterium]